MLRKPNKQKSMSSHPGYWGDVTSNYDWCEDNYVHSHYIAEFFNTMSSIPVALAGILWMRLSLQNHYGISFGLAGLGLFVVGIGSVAFHGTLMRWGQVM